MSDSLWKAAATSDPCDDVSHWFAKRKMMVDSTK